MKAITGRQAGINGRGGEKTMERARGFGEILEVVDTLSLEDQETLIEVVQRRVIERRRADLAQEIRAAQQEFQAGRCRPVTPDELMAEILA